MPGCKTVSEVGMHMADWTGRSKIETFLRKSCAAQLVSEGDRILESKKAHTRKQDRDRKEIRRR